MKLALRCEQVALQNLSAMSTAPVRRRAWSPHTQTPPGTLRDRRKLIGELRERISNGEVISKSPELESQVTAVLGEYVLKMLASWTTKGRAAWAIAQVMVSKRENFGIDSPELRELEREGATLVAPDVYQLRNTRCFLITSITTSGGMLVLEKMERIRTSFRGSGSIATLSYQSPPRLLSRARGVQRIEVKMNRAVGATIANQDSRRRHITLPEFCVFSAVVPSRAGSINRTQKLLTVFFRKLPTRGFRFRGGQCDAELTLCAEADHDYGHIVLAATLVGEIHEPVGG